MGGEIYLLTANEPVKTTPLVLTWISASGMSSTMVLPFAPVAWASSISESAVYRSSLTNPTMSVRISETAMWSPAEKF